MKLYEQRFNTWAVALTIMTERGSVVKQKPIMLIGAVALTVSVLVFANNKGSGKKNFIRPANGLSETIDTTKCFSFGKKTFMRIMKGDETVNVKNGII